MNCDKSNSLQRPFPVQNKKARYLLGYRAFFEGNWRLAHNLPPGSIHPLLRKFGAAIHTQSIDWVKAIRHADHGGEVG